jgi:hypothetical protein
LRHLRYSIICRATATVLPSFAPDARLTTDGLTSYDAHSLGSWPHERRRPGCHWTISLLKRWLPGAHASAVRPKHTCRHLDEYAVRHNRRRTNGVGRIAARVIEQLLSDSR